MDNIKRITFEISLKPFKAADPEAYKRIFTKMFTQWKTLSLEADEIGVMFWTSDGSEILDYRGVLTDTFEWSRFIGGANAKMEWDRKNDPEGKGLHTRPYDYMENPPVYTYGDLKQIVEICKQVGTAITGKPVFAGETFDPGPEFAISDFKYTRHNEVCEGGSMGKKSMVCCYNLLDGDTREYAAYPNGIPDKTPIGTFLGKQSEIFLSDIGFDYIWLSNGFGFGTETWGVNGVLFSGKEFFPEKIDSTEAKIAEFWTLFRKECHFPVQTRGTNLTAGVDFSSDGVNHKMIYETVKDLLPPPNSPWAALDGNFGLELTGYMSRAAELPDEDFLFRFYVHDIWWLNSPWIDRYEAQPHDIYLPTATARINQDGDMKVANHINILSVDNSYGEMPDRCPNEITPYMISSYKNAPDAPSPFVWVYPFREYSTMTSGRLQKSFFEDWYITSAINHGFPLNTVISTDNFKILYEKDNSFLNGSTLVIPMPEDGNPVCDSVVSFVKNGGKIMVYGSLKGADKRILDLLNLKREDEVTGEMTVTFESAFGCELRFGSMPDNIYFDGLLSDGGADAVIASPDHETTVIAHVGSDSKERVIASAVIRKVWNGGSAVWCRGCDCSRKPVDDNDAAKKDDTSHYDSFPAENLMRYLMKFSDYRFVFAKEDIYTKEPVILMHRHDGALWFDGYTPDTTVGITLSTPLGAPLLLANEALVNGDNALYHMPRAWRHECRVFVNNGGRGSVHCKEAIATAYGVERRMLVEGLQDATVYVIPKKDAPEKTFFMLNSVYPHLVSQPFKCKLCDSVYGKVYKLTGITGSLLVSDNI